MKFKHLILLTSFGILMAGCAKEDQNLPQKVDTPKLEMRTLQGMDFVRPEVPPYSGDDGSVTFRGVTTVSPGTDQLQAIINNAGNNETIRLLAGTHTETSTLVINHKVKLTGEPGAVLSLDGFVGLLVSEANGTKITDLEIANNGASFLAVGVENSSHVEFKENDFSGFPFSIVLEQASHAKILNNSIVGTEIGHGVTVINGDFVHVSGNDISGAFFGIWACDRKGTCTNNTLSNNFLGIILCKVPVGSFPLGTGTGGSEFSGNEWNVTNNTASDNLWGYLVIDGAHDNILSNNAGENNLLVDMELAMETNNLFGFTTPTSENNTVNVGGNDIDIIDCGLNNVVHGGTPLPGPCSD